MTKQARTLIVGLLTFLWLGFLMGGYFWGHNPARLGIPDILARFAKTWGAVQFAPNQLWQTLSSIFVWLMLMGVSACLGKWLLRGVWVDEQRPLRVALEIGVGLGVLSLLVGLLGLLGLLTSLSMWAVVLVLAVGCYAQWQAVWADIRAIKWFSPQTGLERWAFLFTVVALVFSFILALAPPTAWDALTYHLTGAKFNIQAGHMVHPTNIPQLGFPLLGQMHFTLGLLLWGEGVTALFQWGYGFLTGLLLVGWVRTHFSSQTAWLTLLALATIPSLINLMGSAYVDVMLLFYATATWVVLLQWRTNKKQAWLVLLGMMVGFCLGVKYTAVAIPLAVTLALIWESRAEGGLIIGKRLLFVGGISLGMIFVWLVENWLTTGNPVYPFLFDGVYWDAWFSWWYERPGTGLAFSEPSRLPWVWLEATFIGAEGSSAYDATIGPYILGLLVLLPFIWSQLTAKQKPLVGHLLLFVGINYIVWVVGLARSIFLLQTRLLWPIWGATAVLVAIILHTIQTWEHPQLNIRWLCNTLIGGTLAVLLISTSFAWMQLNPLPVVLGLEPASQYQLRQLGTYQLAIDTINQLPAESDVMFLWETRSYTCRPMCHPDPLLGRWLHLTQHQQLDADGIAQQWQMAGITHVLMHDVGLQFLIESEYDPYGESELAVLQTLKEEHLVLVEDILGAYQLYELR